MTDLWRAGIRPTRVLALLSGPLLFTTILVWNPFGMPASSVRALAVIAWIAAWWMSEALPIPVTSLLPVVLLPVCGVLGPHEVASLYFNDLLFLLFGGFLLASALEQWGLHRRLALRILARVGTSPMRLCVGFLVAGCLLSMWISNTATALMLLPIALAVSRRLAEELPEKSGRTLEITLLLAVAYGTNLGGIGTYVGTPPNLVFRERFQQDFGAGTPGGPEEISFLGWFVCFAPLALLLLVPIALLLGSRLPRGSSDNAREVLLGEARALGRWSAGELASAVLFGSTAVLWMSRTPLQIGEWTLLGWSRLLPEGLTVSDSTVAMAMVVVAFLIPIRTLGADGSSQRRTILTWTEVERRLPWGMLFLFGGGFALGEACKQSGLSAWLGEALSGRLAHWSPLAILASVGAVLSMLTEVTSNTATANVMLPVLSAVAPDLPLPPASTLLAATIASSFAFMLPVATGPNAIVFATGRVPIRTMAAYGLVLNLCAMIVLPLYLRFVALPLLGL